MKYFIHKVLIYTLSIICFSTIIGCNKVEITPITPDETPDSTEVTPDKPLDDVAKRTVMIYMLAENSLGNYNFDKQNIDSIKEAFTHNHIDGRFIIFKSGQDKAKYILEIYKNLSGNVVVDTLKHYDPDIVTTDISTMQTVFGDMHTLAPAHSYGLIMWSHATGWLPQNHYYTSTPQRNNKPQSFGREGDNRLSIDIDNIRVALEDFHFDFILFDACMMGSVEVAYELRNICDYIIACPTETMGAGFPYRDITPLLFDNEIDYHSVCDAYTQLYIEGTNSSCGTISLIDTRYLDKLSEVCSSIVYEREKDIDNIDTKHIQYYDRTSTHVFFDLEHYLRQLADSTRHNDLLQALDKAVPYKQHSERFLTIYINNYCGLSSYIPGSSNDPVVENYYKTLQWTQDVYLK